MPRGDRFGAQVSGIPCPPAMGFASLPPELGFHCSASKTQPNLLFHTTNRTERGKPVLMDTIDHVLINCKPTGASRVSQSQLSFGVAALNINQALLQNPEMLRGGKSPSPPFFTSIFFFCKCCFSGLSSAGDSSAGSS